MTAITPRWEWRTFGSRFGPAEAVFEALTPSAVQESDELYLLSGAGDNVKVRDEPHGHQGPQGGGRGRPGMLDAGDEGDLPAGGRGCGAGLRCPPAARPGPDAGRLSARPVHRRAGSTERSHPPGERAQAPRALHGGQLHGGGVRGVRGRTCRPAPSPSSPRTRQRSSPPSVPSASAATRT